MKTSISSSRLIASALLSLAAVTLLFAAAGLVTLEREELDGKGPRPDQPDEAQRFRNLQLQDENKKIPADGLLKAKAQIEVMKAAQAERARLAGKPNGIKVAGLSPSDWISLGPGSVGGRIRSIVIDPNNANKMWVGSVGGGIWRSTNAGASWLPVNDFMANLAISTLVIDPTNSNILYAGTGEAFAANVNPDGWGFAPDGLRGLGVFKSTDGGGTWNQLAGTNPADVGVCPGGGGGNCPWSYVNRLAISPDGSTILAATSTNIWRSTDGGATWNLAGGVLGTLFDVDFDPTNNQLAICGGAGAALFSNDGGQNWGFATFTPPITGRVEVAYAPSNSVIVYASVNQNQGDIYQSSDGGQNYSITNTGNNFLGGQGTYDNIIWVNPQNPNFVIVGGISLYRSTDGGFNWSMIADGANASPHSDHHMVVAHPLFDNTTNKTVYFSNDGGLYRTDDVLTASLTSGWTNLNNNLGITQFYGAAANANGVIIGGTQDNGTQRYTPGTPGTWSLTSGGDGGYCAADPGDPAYFYAEYTNLTLQRSTDGGASASYIYCNPVPTNPNGGPCTGTGILDAQSGPNNSNANFVAPFILDPGNTNTMLAGGISLWRSNDVKTAGIPTWTPIKATDPIPQPAPNPPLPNPISAIAISPATSNTIVVGHNNGNIFITFDGTGTTPPTSPAWSQINRAPLPARFVTRLVIDVTRSPNWIYATFGGFSADNVYVTQDLGATWTDVSGAGATDLPSVPVRSLVIHPANGNFLYVGTESGVFASEDAGATWQLPQEGPANVSVDELFWMQGNLVAVTHGRGLFRTTTPVYPEPNCNFVGDSSPIQCTSPAVYCSNYGCGVPGDWNFPCTWNNRRVPTQNDDVVISCPVTVHNGSASARNLRVDNRLSFAPGANLFMPGGTLINNGIIDGPGAELRSKNLLNAGLINAGRIWAVNGDVISDHGVIALASTLECNSLSLLREATLSALSVLCHNNLAVGPDATLSPLSSDPTLPAALRVHGDIHNDGLINSSGQVQIPTVSPAIRTLSGTGTWQLASFTIGDPYNPNNGATVQLANDLTFNIGSQIFFDHDSFFISKSSTLLQNNHDLTINSESVFSWGFIDLGTGALNLNGNYFRFFVGSGSPTRLLGTGTINLTATGVSPFLSISTHIQPAFRMLAGTVNAQLTNNFDRSITIDPGATLNFNQGSINVFGDITVNGALGKTSPPTTLTTLIFNGATLTNNGSLSGPFLGFNYNVSGVSRTQSIAGTGSWSSGRFLQIGLNAATSSTTTLMNDVTINYDAFGIGTGSSLNTGAFTFSMPCSTNWQGGGEAFGNLRRTNLAACSVPVAFGSPFTTVRFTSGTSPTEMSVRVASSTPPGFINAISRTYNITPTGGSGYAATLRLHYLDSELNGNNESTLQLVRQDGASWSPQGATSRDPFNNWVESTNVTQFSPWTLSSLTPPPPPTTFANWQQGYFTPAELGNPAISGDDADPDGDDLSNVLEYAFHSDPKQPSAASRPYTRKDATYISLIYTKAIAPTDLTYIIEKSPDLIDWSPVIPVNVILADDGVTQTIKAQVPIMGATRIYLRLRVSR